MPCLFLALAITAEVIGTSLLECADGSSRLWPTVGSPGMYGVSFALPAQMLRAVPVGVAHAMWSGPGTAAIDAAFPGEPLTVTKVLGVSPVISGVVVLGRGGAH